MYLQGENEEGQGQRRNYRGTRVYRRRQDGEQQGTEEGEGRHGRVSGGDLFTLYPPKLSTLECYQMPSANDNNIMVM